MKRKSLYVRSRQPEPFIHVYICDGLASHPGERRNTPIVSSCYKNRDKLWTDGTIDSRADFLNSYSLTIKGVNCTKLH